MPRRTHQSAWSAQVWGDIRPMERPAGEPTILQGTALLAAILVVAVLAIAAFSGV